MRMNACSEKSNGKKKLTFVPSYLELINTVQPESHSNSVEYRTSSLNSLFTATLLRQQTEH